jgi:hypothetical protein
MPDNDFDFGFTFADDEFSGGQTTPTTPSPALVDPEFKDELFLKIQRLEQQIEALTEGDTTELIEQHKKLLTKEVHGKLQEVEQLILPLLYNLQKNPEKEYIHWPNRKDIIQKQIERIQQVTRYYGKN